MSLGLASTDCPHSRASGTMDLSEWDLWLRQGVRSQDRLNVGRTGQGTPQSPRSREGDWPRGQGSASLPLVSRPHPRRTRPQSMPSRSAPRRDHSDSHCCSPQGPGLPVLPLSAAGDNSTINRRTSQPLLATRPSSCRRMLYNECPRGAPLTPPWSPRTRASCRQMPVMVRDTRVTVTKG